MTYWKKKNTREDNSRCAVAACRYGAQVPEGWRAAANRKSISIYAKGYGEKKVIKGTRGMPRLSEAKKDVISCDKHRGSANET